ncbi:hypothetical protein, partial [Pseudonocardia zijingensis]
LARRERAERRAERAAAIANLGRRLRPVAPLAVVTGFAMYGQIGYGLDHYSDPTTPFLLRLLVAVGAAVAVESIALYVAWHAHDALLLKATGTAARLRRASYAIALAVAAVNYAHFSGPNLAPTAGAVVFALFSASGPWLWGLHTRRAQRLQLLREGRVDSSGAVFSAERWRTFPLRTWLARRYSIDHGITDPRIAWEAYRLERQRRDDNLPATWQQLATSLLRLDAQQHQAAAAANMVSPIDVPDPEQVDDHGVAQLRKTAPPATVREVEVSTTVDEPADAKPRRQPRRRTTSRRVNTPAPTPKALQLIAAGGIGRRELARQCGVSEDTARKWIDAHRTTSEVTR